MYGFEILSGEGIYSNGKNNRCQIFQVIQGLSFDLDKEDSWVWKGGEAVSYTVKLIIVLGGVGKGRMQPYISSFGSVKRNLPHSLLLGG